MAKSKFGLVTADRETGEIQGVEVQNYLDTRFSPSHIGPTAPTDPEIKIWFDTSAVE